MPSLQRLFHHCSREDIYLRFFRYLRSLSVAEAVRLCTGSQGLDAVFVAVVGERESEHLVASACFFGEATTRLAEVGYLVDPEWQGGGLGRELQTLLIAKARALGFRGLSPDFSPRGEPRLKVSMVNIRTATPSGLNRFGTGAERGQSSEWEAVIAEKLRVLWSKA